MSEQQHHQLNNNQLLSEDQILEEQEITNAITILKSKRNNSRIKIFHYEEILEDLQVNYKQLIAIYLGQI